MLAGCGRDPVDSGSDDSDTTAAQGTAEEETGPLESGGEAESTSGSSGESETSADTESSETGPVDTSEGGADPLVEMCFVACEDRRTGGDIDGFCPFDWMQELPCEAWCESQFSALEEPEYLAGIECIREDPLCFQDMDTCVCNKTTPGNECF